MFSDFFVLRFSLSETCQRVAPVEASNQKWARRKAVATSARIPSALLALRLLTAQVSAAYENPLDPISVREAYFLGQRNDDKLAEFLAQYVKRLPLPKQGPHIAEIELRTPYEQVVVRSHQHSIGYSAQQAEKDYRAQSDLIVLRVQINLTPSYSGYSVQTAPGSAQPRPEDFWRDFSIRLIQDKPITPKKITGRPLYRGRLRPYSGVDVELEFETVQISSGPVRVEVLTPEGQSVDVEYDLEKLR